MYMGVSNEKEKDEIGKFSKELRKFIFELKFTSVA